MRCSYFCNEMFCCYYCDNNWKVHCNFRIFISYSQFGRLQNKLFDLITRFNLKYLIEHWSIDPDSVAFNADCFISFLRLITRFVSIKYKCCFLLLLLFLDKTKFCFLFLRVCLRTIYCLLIREPWNPYRPCFFWSSLSSATRVLTPSIMHWTSSTSE